MRPFAAGRRTARTAASRGGDTGLARRPSFAPGGGFLGETRRDVERYLESRRTRARGLAQLYAKAVVSLGTLVGSWAFLIFGSPGAPGIAICLAGLVLGVLLVGFCVQHDANHGAYFRSRRANHLLGWSADSLLGFSSYTWRVKHNVAHHTYTNVDGHDDDIDQTPFARLAPAQRRRPWHRWQHLYMWGLYSLLVIRWQTGADVSALVRRRVGSTAVRLPRRWELAGLVAGKAFFVGWALVVPLLVYRWWAVLAVYVGLSMVASVLIAVTFQLAHCVEEADFATASDLAATERAWAVHEIESTVDFCPRNPVLTWFLGGLNFQIEHHLFPRVPHTHYPQIAAIVRRNAARHGIRYTAQPSLRAALRSHFRHLRSMGRLGRVVEIEMG